MCNIQVEVRFSKTVIAKTVIYKLKYRKTSTKNCVIIKMICVYTLLGFNPPKRILYFTWFSKNKV